MAFRWCLHLWTDSLSYPSLPLLSLDLDWATPGRWQKFLICLSLWPDSTFCSGLWLPYTDHHLPPACLAPSISPSTFWPQTLFETETSRISLRRNFLALSQPLWKPLTGRWLEHAASFPEISLLLLMCGFPFTDMQGSSDQTVAIWFR